MPKDSSFHPGVSSPQQSRQNQKDHRAKPAESLTTLMQRFYVHLLLDPKSIYKNVVLRENVLEFYLFQVYCNKKKYFFFDKCEIKSFNVYSQ